MFNLQINKRLQDILGNIVDFGGVSIIAIGDVFQLQPVFDALETPYNLWNKHFTMFELNEIMRQRKSKTFAQILNRLREGLQTPGDIGRVFTSDFSGRYASDNRKPRENSWLSGLLKVKRVGKLQ